MASSSGKATQPSGSCNGTAADFSNVEQELYDYQMHTKMCKKIAQLTKVIYSLNTKNEEHEAALQSLRESHQEELRRATEEAQQRSRGEGEEAGEVEAELRKRLQAAEDSLEQQLRLKAELQADFEAYRQQVDERALRAEREHSERVLAVSEEALDTRRDLESRLQGLDRLTEQLGQEKERAAAELERAREESRGLREECEELRRSAAGERGRLEEACQDQSHALRAELEALREKKASLEEAFERTLRELKEAHGEEQEALRRSLQQSLADSLAQWKQRELEQQQSQQAALQERLARTEAELEAGVQRLNETKRHCLKAQERIQDLEVQLEEGRRRVAGAEAEARKAEEELAVAKERLLLQENELLTTSEELLSQCSSQSKASAEVDELRAQVCHLQKQVKDLEQQTSGKTSDHAREVKQHVEALSAQRQELQRAHAEELRRIRRQTEEERGRLKEHLRKRLEEVMKKHAGELRSAQAAVDAERKKAQRDLQTQADELKRRSEEERRELEEEREELQRRLQESVSEISRLESAIQQGQAAQGGATPGARLPCSTRPDAVREELELRAAGQAQVRLPPSVSPAPAAVQRLRPSPAPLTGTEKLLLSAHMALSLNPGERRASKDQSDSAAGAFSLKDLLKWYSTPRIRFHSFFQEDLELLKEKHQEEISAMKREKQTLEDRILEQAQKNLDEKKRSESESEFVRQELTQQHLSALSRLRRDKDAEIKEMKESFQRKIDALQSQLKQEEKRIDSGTDVRHKGEFHTSVERESLEQEIEKTMKLNHSLRAQLQSTIQEKEQLMQHQDFKEMEERLWLQYEEALREEWHSHQQALRALEERAQEEVQAERHRQQAQQKLLLDRQKAELTQQHADWCRQMTQRHMQQIEDLQAELRTHTELVALQQDFKQQNQAQAFERQLEESRVEVAGLRRENSELKEQLATLRSQVESKTQELYRLQDPEQHQSTSVPSLRCWDEGVMNRQHMEVENLKREHRKEIQTIVSDFSSAQTRLQARIVALETELREKEEQSKRRESRIEDLQVIGMLQDKLSERDQVIKRLVEERHHLHQHPLVTSDSTTLKAYENRPQPGSLTPTMRKKRIDDMPPRVTSVPNLSSFEKSFLGPETAAGVRSPQAVKSPSFEHGRTTPRTGTPTTPVPEPRQAVRYSQASPSEDLHQSLNCYSQPARTPIEQRVLEPGTEAQDPQRQEWFTKYFSF
ncbi:protein FAM184B [Megalops cyprinoides]|uniref:protein FAM184B n=1 Tax=Megalops cyprinoides TaxID=118141 RepID=UPI0018655BBD|nr:protein FAM184B [Megalops cyprinoides]